MSNISNLFYSTDTNKQTLHKRITPSSEQQKMQQEYWNNLAEYLKGDLEETSDYVISSWIQGSYKFGTQTRPVDPSEEFDIDLGIYFNWAGEPVDGKYSPREMKSLVQESLKEYAVEDSENIIEVVEPPKTRCARVRFKDNFHIDVPVYHLDPDKDSRFLATENNEWEDSDPKSLYLWFKEKCTEDDNNQIKRLIRYIKIWASLNIDKDKRPSTIMLTVLTVIVFPTLTEEQKSGDDIALRHLIEQMIIHFKNSSEILNPVNKTENINRLDSDNNNLFLEKLNIFLELSIRAIDAKTDLDSAVLWQEAFFHFFPLPVVEENNQSNTLVPVQFIPNVSIIAIPSNNKNLVYKGVNKIDNIPKNCVIKFILNNFNELPFGAHVEWVVRNEGEEAEFKNDLGHVAGIGREGEEHSAYSGKHYMDVIVKSAINQIIGFLRIPVSISGIFAPPRNPIKRPWNGRVPKK